MIPIRTCTGRDLRWRSLSPTVSLSLNWDFAVEADGEPVASACVVDKLSMTFCDSEGELTIRNAGVDPHAGFIQRYIAFFRNPLTGVGSDTRLIDETTHEEIARDPIAGGNLRFADGTEYVWGPKFLLAREHTWSQAGGVNAIITFQSDVIRIREQPRPDHTRFLVALGLRNLIF